MHVCSCCWLAVQSILVVGFEVLIRCVQWALFVFLASSSWFITAHPAGPRCGLNWQTPCGATQLCEKSVQSWLMSDSLHPSLSFRASMNELNLLLTWPSIGPMLQESFGVTIQDSTALLAHCWPLWGTSYMSLILGTCVHSSSRLYGGVSFW